MSKHVVALGAFVAQVAAGPTLPAPELFVQQTGLKVALQLAEPVLHVGQDPQFVLRFENTGSGGLYLSPVVEPRFYVTRADGTRVPPILRGIAERAGSPTIKASDLIRLERGKSWAVPVSPISYEEGLTAYAEHGFAHDSGWALLLPPGRYVARFTYSNGAGAYDPYEVPRGVWEGRLEADSIAFTVIAPTPDQLARDVSRLDRQQVGASLIRLLSLAPGDVVDEFIAKPESRANIVRAASVQRETMLPRLLKALDSLDGRQRSETLNASGLLELLHDQPDCSSLQYLIAEISSARGDVLPTLRPVFESAAPRCPDIRGRLRSIAQETTQTPDARSNAAALLGTFKNPADVPLLIDMLDTAPSAAPDPIARGAATGLAAIGGQPARQALTQALSNEQRALAIGAEAINRLGTIGGSDIVEPLLGALSSTHTDVVVGALGALRLTRQPTSAPQLLALLRHPNATIRVYAATLVRWNGGDGFQEAMRAAVSDVNPEVQQNALSYLAEHGDASDLELFLSHLDSRNQWVREAATAGVSQFGSAATFPRVRKLLDAPSSAAKSAEVALSRLSFVEALPRWTSQQWDDWYARHRDTPRTQWAREALRGLTQMPPYEQRWQWSAFSFLADQGAATFRADFESASASRRPLVRIEAARAIARVDRNHAAALLVREFDGRVLSGCDTANRALNELAAANRQVDCTNPVDRRRARDEWARTNLSR